MEEISGVFWNQILYLLSKGTPSFSSFPANVSMHGMEAVVLVKPAELRRGGGHPKVQNTNICYLFFGTGFYSWQFQDTVFAGPPLRGVGALSSQLQGALRQLSSRGGHRPVTCTAL
jgi:hypothetical protein